MDFHQYKLFNFIPFYWDFKDYVHHYDNAGNDIEDPNINLYEMNAKSFFY